MTITAITQDQASGTIGMRGSILKTKLDEIIAECNVLEAALSGATDPWNYVGVIAAAANFPTVASVDSGDVYKVTADVTDNDPTKTNTGKSFLSGTKIVWNGTTWEDLGIVESVSLLAATPITIGAGNIIAYIDTATIAGPVAVALPAVSAGRLGKVVVIGDYTNDAAANNITITPNGTNEIDGVNAAIVLDKNGELVALQCVGAAGWKTIYRTTLPSATSHVAAVAPTVNDDITMGYFVGTRWIDTVGGRTYFCHDNANGAAVWVSHGVEAGGTLHANVIAGGAAGFMTGADKTILDAVADDHVSARCLALDIKVDESEKTAALSGDGVKSFVPTHVILKVVGTSGALNADGTINVGTATDGAQILSAQALTGLTALGASRVIPLAAATLTVLSNATLYANVEAAETGAGALTLDVLIVGRQL